MFEDGHVQRLCERTADRAVARPPDFGAQQLYPRNADSQGQVDAGGREARNPEPARRQIFETRLSPRPRALADIADQRHSRPWRIPAVGSSVAIVEFLVFHSATLIICIWGHRVTKPLVFARPKG
jgi:hypothetical protein